MCLKRSSNKRLYIDKGSGYFTMNPGWCDLDLAVVKYSNFATAVIHVEKVPFDVVLRVKN